MSMGIVLFSSYILYLWRVTYTSDSSNLVKEDFAMIEKIYGEKLSSLVDLMIHEYDERYGLKLFEQFNPSKYASVKRLAEQTAYDMNQIMER